MVEIPENLITEILYSDKHVFLDNHTVLDSWFDLNGFKKRLDIIRKDDGNLISEIKSFILNGMTPEQVRTLLITELEK